MTLFFRFWGKAAADEEPSCARYHLLPYHGLDVAACGYQMAMKNTFGLADCLAKLGFIDQQQSARWFAYFLACHDIGKYSRGFQQLYHHQHPELVPAIEHVIYAVRHDQLGYYLWQEHLAQNQEVLFDHQTSSRLDYYLQQWMIISTGHHGIPPELPAKGKLCFHEQDIQAAQQYLQALKTVFNFDQYPDFFYDKSGFKSLKQQSWHLASYTVLADWLGSDSLYFPYHSQQMPLSDYWQKIALPQAEHAVQMLPNKSQIAPFSGITQLFPFIKTATPLQQYALDIDLSHSGPKLFILEDVTGAGKTEAAMILAHRLLSLAQQPSVTEQCSDNQQTAATENSSIHNHRNQAQGLYIGLPTMATANAMYERLADAYHALFATDSTPSLVLAHGARQMSKRFSQSIWRENRSRSLPDNSTESEGSAECHSWFADSNKKALLAEIGVGTLDQLLIAIMPFRHQVLKLLGLANKVLILDEVHAYDAYQNKLLESLLSYHASQGGNAIILTATLPFQQRERLLTAFNKGAGFQPTAPNPAAGYPWFSYLSHDGLSETPLLTRAEVKRQVGVKWLYGLCDGLALMKQALINQQCLCWIRNSVDDAINLYQQLVTDPEIDTNNILLFHSRFAFCDRLEIENQVLTWFGKNSTPDIRQGKILIATQVVEQSLDIDFDLMISDIAPIDLLIQRAGRLQRHIRDKQGRRKTGHDSYPSLDERPLPQLYLLAPEWQETITDKNWLGDDLKNSGYVYADQAKLWLTQSILRQRQQINMPDDARLLIEFVYGEQQEIPELLQLVSQKEEGKIWSKRGAAEQSTLTFAEGYNHNASCYGWSDEINLSTRLSEPTIELYLTYYNDNNQLPDPYCVDQDFPWEKSRIQIRQSLWQKIHNKLPIPEETVIKALRQRIHKPNAQFVLLTRDQQVEFYSRKTGLFIDK